MTLRNRLYRAPVLEGAAGTRDPAGTYAKHFVPNARAGVGLIVQGCTVPTPEGRTSPGMSVIAERADMLDLRRVTDGVHAHGAKIVVQLGHGGMFALESWHRDYVARRTTLPLAPSTPPWWLRAVHGGVHVLTDDEIVALARRFGTVAAWSRDAGYDGVQIASSNAKLLHQFLSRTYNRRTDRWGGDLRGRAALLVEIREAIAREAGAHYPVLLKLCVREDGPLGHGVTFDEGLQTAQIAADAGYAAITPVATSPFPDTALCKGDFPAASFQAEAVRTKLVRASSATRTRGIEWAMRFAAWRSPFEPVWNHEIFAQTRRAVGVPVFAVGGIRTPAEAEAILAAGEADLIGIGRPFYAEPDLPRWFLAGAHQQPACASCNRCLVPQMLGMPGVCYNPAAKERARSTSIASPNSCTSAPADSARA